MFGPSLVFRRAGINSSVVAGRTFPVNDSSGGRVPSELCGRNVLYQFMKLSKRRWMWRGIAAIVSIRRAQFPAAAHNI